MDNWPYFGWRFVPGVLDPGGGPRKVSWAKQRRNGLDIVPCVALELNVLLVSSNVNTFFIARVNGFC